MIYSENSMRTNYLILFTNNKKIIFFLKNFLILIEFVDMSEIRPCWKQRAKRQSPICDITHFPSDVRMKHSKVPKHSHTDHIPLFR